MRLLLVAFALALLPFGARAADAPNLTPWQINVAESRLGFIAMADGPIEGSFKRFSGTIIGDPEHLPQSKITIDVDVASVMGDLPDITDLVKPEWFDAPSFPMARYESATITKRPDGKFEAAGTLSLHGITAPATLVFALTSYGPKKGAPGITRAVAEGTAALTRTGFNIGLKTYPKTNLLADPVTVTFTLTAERPAH